MAKEIRQTIKTDNLIHKDGAFFVRNMRKTSTGGVETTPRLSKQIVQSSGTRQANLDEIMDWAERDKNQETSLWGIDKNGNLFLFSYVLHITQGMDNSEESSFKNPGIAVDSNNEIVYSTGRYMGTTVTTQLNGNVSSGDSTITISDTTGVPSSGYAVITSSSSPGFNTSTETIQYTGTSGSDITGVTRGKFNTSDLSHNNGARIIFFDDDYKDFGSETSYGRPAYKWEDIVLIANDRYVATWDGTTFTPQDLDLPAGYEIVGFSEIPTGTGSTIVIAANYGSRGELFFWNGSASTWTTRVQVNEEIDAIHRTYVATARGIYKTDGYRIQLAATFPDDATNPNDDSHYINDMNSLRERYLLITDGGDILPRNQAGLWIFDMQTKEMSLIVSKEAGIDTDLEAINTSSTLGWTIISSDYNGGSIFQWSESAGSRGSIYQHIYNPNTASILQLKGINLNVDFPDTRESNLDGSWEVIVRYFDYTREPFHTSQTTDTTTDKDKLIIHDYNGTPQSGDRIEGFTRDVESDPNCAFVIRNITNVSHDAGNNKYTLTLDEDLPAAMDDTDYDVMVSPLKKAKKISGTDYDINLENFMIKIPKGPLFRKLLIEVEFRSDSSYNPVLRLNSIEIISQVWRT